MVRILCGCNGASSVTTAVSDVVSDPNHGTGTINRITATPPSSSSLSLSSIGGPTTTSASSSVSLPSFSTKSESENKSNFPLMGKVFLREYQEVGIRSIHFNQVIDTYISYESDPYPGAKLDDGTPWPNRMQFSDYSYDRNERKFSGSFSFNAKNFTWELVFDTQFFCVLSGNIVTKKVDGQEFVTTAGKDFCYVNANLKGKINLHTLKRLEDEGASEKTLSYLRKYLLSSSLVSLPSCDHHNNDDENEDTTAIKCSNSSTPPPDNNDDNIEQKEEEEDQDQDQTPLDEEDADVVVADTNQTHSLTSPDPDDDDEEESDEWKEHQDDDGKIYYYNATTQERAWEKPGSSPIGGDDDADVTDGGHDDNDDNDNSHHDNNYNDQQQPISIEDEIEDEPSTSSTTPPITSTPTTTTPESGNNSNFPLMGKVFLKDNEKVGHRSIHFHQEIDTYLSYEGNPYTGVKLTNGTPWPSRMLFSDTSFDRKERKFSGAFSFGNTCADGGVKSQQWVLVFDTQFLCVLSGSIVRKNVGGQEFVTTAGKDFCYVNANLKGKINIDTLKQLEDEGASEKTLSYLRPHLEI